MKTSKDFKNWHFKGLWLSAPSALLALALLLSGCENPSGAPGGRPGGGAMPGRTGSRITPSAEKVPVSVPNKMAFKKPLGKPPEDLSAVPGGNPPQAQPTAKIGDLSAPVNPLAPTARVEQAGLTVELASSIIAMGANPFLDRLPKPIVEAPILTDASAPPPVSIPVDPFSSVSLMGVVYNNKAPIALIAVAGAQAQTVLARSGMLIMTDGSQLKVVKIHPNSVDLQVAGDAQQKKSLMLPDIVGFDAKASTSPSNSNGSPETPASASMPALPQAHSPKGQNIATPAILGNLKKLLTEPPAEKPVAKPVGKGASAINLQEP